MRYLYFYKLFLVLIKSIYLRYTWGYRGSVLSKQLSRYCRISSVDAVEPIRLDG